MMHTQCIDEKSILISVSMPSCGPNGAFKPVIESQRLEVQRVYHLFWLLSLPLHLVRLLSWWLKLSLNY